MNHTARAKPPRRRRVKGVETLTLMRTDKYNRSTRFETLRGCRRAPEPTFAAVEPQPVRHQPCGPHGTLPLMQIAEFTGPARHGAHRPRVAVAVAVAVTAAVALLVAGLGARAFAGDLTWVEDDWSGGAYASIQGIDADIEPGLLALINHPEDMRFVAEPTAQQGIYTIAAVHDTLFLGAGPYPIMTDGADILSYDYASDTFALDYSLYEQGVIALKAYGDTLYAPGPDSQGSWLWGNVYLRDRAGWTRQETVPSAVHLFDIAVGGGSIYTTGGDRFSNGSIWRSDDRGETFTEAFQIPYGDGADGVRRFYGCEAYQGRLFFQPDGRGGDQFVLRYDGTVWDSLAMSAMPLDRQGVFTAWGDSLLFSVSNRFYIIHGDQVTARWQPFQGNTWGRGVYKYGDAVYGGAQSGLLYRWRPETGWTQIDQLGLDPATEEIEGLARYRGRLYVSTSRPDGYAGGRLYVSASAASGALVSQAHDFGRPVAGGVLAWDACSPGAGNVARLQLRSSTTLALLAQTPFTGPDGTAHTYYQASPAAVPVGHHGDRFFQYRVELLCPDGLRMPWLSRVALEVDTLAVAGVAGGDPWGGETGANGYRALPLEIVAARPNPARGPIEVTLELRDDASGAGATMAGSGLATVGSATETALLRIVDVQGRAVRSAHLTVRAGVTTPWQWDLRDDRGQPVATGLYQLRVSIPGSNGPAARSRAVVVLR
jgi:hypothetical protein